MGFKHRCCGALAGGLFALLAMMWIQIVEADSHTVSKVAGIYSSTGFSGDGGQATSAQLYFPKGAYLDTIGTMFIADNYNNRLRQVDASGIITTVFGGSSSSIAGNGGAATAATGGVYNIKCDTVGNLFIVDFTNAKVRKISNGMAYAFAGGGSGIIDGIPATSTYLDTITGVATDTAGNVYIPAGHSYKVKEVLLSTGNMYTTVGTGTVAATTEAVGVNGDGGQATAAAIHTPGNLCVDSASRLYFASFEGYSIRRVDLITGIISFFTGNGVATYSGDGGPATSAGIAAQNGVSADSLGNVYISNESPGKVRLVDITTSLITLFAGGGSFGQSSGDGHPATAASFGIIYDVDVQGDKVIFADASNAVVRMVSLAPIPPSEAPTVLPTLMPSMKPSVLPSAAPTCCPTMGPTFGPTIKPTVSPTTAPTFSPFIPPTEVPTLSPSAGPSVGPTIQPSIMPSEVPTTHPSALPSLSPTQSPSIVPSISPSAMPSLEPSSMPTVKPTAPTKKPTSLPTVKPTRATVTTSPTFGATTPPTAAPTTQLDISFDASLLLFNTTDSLLSSADEAAVTNSVADTIGAYSGSVSVISSSVVNDARRVLTASHGPPYNLMVVVNVVASTADYPGMNGSALYRHLSGTLIDAVESSEFNAHLATAARTFSAFGLYYVSNVNLTVSAYSAMPAAVSDGNKSDDDDMNTRDYAGIVIGILMSFLTLVAGCYVCMRHSNNDQLPDHGETKV